MRWRVAELFAMDETRERDALGNPVRARRSLGVVPVRVSPFGQALTDSPGNAYRASSLTLVTPAPLSSVRGAEYVRSDVSGETETYRVTQLSDVGRWRLLSATRTKGDEWQGSPSQSTA